jgi:hypothetical protein
LLSLSSTVYQIFARLAKGKTTCAVDAGGFHRHLLN